MRDTTDTLKTVGIIVLGIFAVIVGVPLLLAVLGIAAFTGLAIFLKLVALAILAIKLAVVAAIVYLLVVGVRTLLR
jgi:hypothetical protein